MKIIFLISFFLLTTQNFGQIILESYKNTPEPETKYYFRKINFNYVNAIDSGNGLIWDFSDIIFLNETDTETYTRDTNFVSFPGINFPHVTLDTSYLRSEEAIFRVTDSIYSRFYKVVLIPVVAGPTVLYQNEPIFKFPFQYGDSINWNYTINGSIWPYNGSILKSWKKADGFGSMILPGVTYSNLIRTNYCFEQIDHLSHDYDTTRLNIYEWYADTSHVPILRLIFSFSLRWDNFSYYTNYDTTAWFNYDKFNSVNEIKNKNNEIWTFQLPGEKKLHIKSLVEIQEIKIYSLSGQLIYVTSPFSSTVSISTLGWSEGVYIISTTLKDKSISVLKCMVKK